MHVDVDRNSVVFSFRFPQNIHGSDNDRRTLSCEVMQVFQIGRPKWLEFLYVTTITQLVICHETTNPSAFPFSCKFLSCPTMDWGNISGERWFCKTDYITVPDVALEGGPRPELVYIIVKGLNVSEQYTLKRWMVCTLSWVWLGPHLTLLVHQRFRAASGMNRTASKFKQRIQVRQVKFLVSNCQSNIPKLFSSVGTINILSK